MRIRFSMELRVSRDPEAAPHEPQFEHRDNDGTMIIHHDQPRYIGFQREDPGPTDA